MGVAHGFGDLARPLEGIGTRDRACGQRLLQGLAGHQLHDDRLGVAVVFDGVHLDEGRMAQRGAEPRLAHQVGTMGAGIGMLDAFDGDAAAQLAVPGFIHPAEAAFAGHPRTS